MSAVTRHITYHVTMPDEALVKEDVTKEELDIAVMKMTEAWEPEDGKSSVEMHFKGLRIHVVAEAKIIEKPIGVAYGECDGSIQTLNWDDLTQEFLEQQKTREFAPPIIVVP